MKILVLLFLLLPFAAGAAEDNNDAALAQVRSAIAMQQAAGALQSALAGIQKITAAAPATAPVAAPAAEPVPAPTPTVLSELRDGLVSLASILIPALVAMGLTWLRSHLKIMQDAAMNDAITTSANGFAALLVQAIQQRSGSLATLSPHSPEVSPLATALLNSYPQFTAALGMSSEKAGFVILKEAAKIVSAMPDAALPVAPVDHPAVVPVTQPATTTDHSEDAHTQVVPPAARPRGLPLGALSPSVA